MSEASLAAQKLARQSMLARPALLALVDGQSIFDRHSRPEIWPCIVLGEAQVVDDSADCVDGSDVYLTIHVWTKEDSFVQCKSIAGEVRRAMRDVTGLVDGFDLVFDFEDARYLRDPSGEHSHGVLTFHAIAEDTVGIL
ncbi:DUF3168 domain-containing protein [Mesorhizobium sp. CN2-181]|uniref:DUF3168 domain-containing protein n=1 Tax=Mesorhizobium yinganensis TaxID=3157707 RepID=UPI0032B87BB7